MSRTHTWKFLVAVMLLAIIPGLVCAQGRFGGKGSGRGGFGGRGGGRGGFNRRGGGGRGFDAGKIFDFMAKRQGSTDSIDISKMRMGREGLEAYAKAKGITNGKLTREQYSDYWKNRDKYGGGFGRGGRGRGGFRMGGDKSFKSLSKEEQEKRVNDGVNSYFNRDRNKDGFLDQSEMSRTLRENLAKFDRNKDGKISREETKLYIQGWLDGSMQKQANQKSSQKSKGNVVDQSILDQRPVVYRAGNLPKDLPAWFSESDTDNDGQIGLYEWRGAGKSLSEFDRFDRNGDGLLTAEEMMYYQTYIVQADTKLAFGKTDGNSKGPPSFSPGGGSGNDSRSGFSSRRRRSRGSNDGNGGGFPGSFRGRSRRNQGGN